MYAVQFIFISSGYINLFVRLNFLFLLLSSAETRDLPRNSCFILLCEIIKNKKNKCFFFFHFSRGKGRQPISLKAQRDRQKTEVHRRTLPQWMHFGFTQLVRLWRGGGANKEPRPLSSAFSFLRTNVTGCCTDFKNISQRNKKKTKQKHIQQKWTKRREKKSQPTGRDTQRLSFVKKTDKHFYQLSIIIFYGRYLFMLSSPTNSQGSCEYIYS